MAEAVAEGLPPSAPLRTGGDLGEVARYGKCLPCFTERNLKIGSPTLELTREAPTGEPMTLPSERQWKEGLRWQRR